MTWTLRGVVAVSSLLSGVLHYVIWADHGYRGAPVKEMFLAQAVIAVIAGLVALAPSRWAAVPAVAVAAASLVAFSLSRTSGVPTLHGTFSERGLEPASATVAGISSTLLILLAEAATIIAGAALIVRAQAAQPTPVRR